jgi:hypothetical protein
MTRVPFIPALFALVLTLPFLYAAGALIGLITPPHTYWADPFTVLNNYGAIYLGMLGGVYWGFAAKRANILDALIALTPPFAAFGASVSPVPALPLAIGIAAMLVFDLLYISRGMAPKYWLPLRLYSGLIAIAALLYAYYA